MKKVLHDGSSGSAGHGGIGGQADGGRQARRHGAFGVQQGVGKGLPVGHLGGRAGERFIAAGAGAQGAVVGGFELQGEFLDDLGLAAAGDVEGGEPLTDVGAPVHGGPLS
ncbi:MAG: hypothetical protein Q8L86_01515 [Vicinamibacterales bacterium]|nr:hypothetical protein [Vicinamibacterales bacterium]